MTESILHCHAYWTRNPACVSASSECNRTYKFACFQQVGSADAASGSLSSLAGGGFGGVADSVGFGGGSGGQSSQVLLAGSICELPASIPLC